MLSQETSARDTSAQMKCLQTVHFGTRFHSSKAHASAMYLSLVRYALFGCEKQLRLEG